MKAILKYPIFLEDEFSISMPVDAVPLYVNVQRGEPFLWALATVNGRESERTFYVAGTGHPVASDRLYVGSFMLYEGAFVGHLFEGEFPVESIPGRSDTSLTAFPKDYA
jgi:hypothetical protein